jgi:hypothetical protein
MASTSYLGKDEVGCIQPSVCECEACTICPQVVGAGLNNPIRKHAASATRPKLVGFHSVEEEPKVFAISQQSGRERSALRPTEDLFLDEAADLKKAQSFECARLAGCTALRREEISVMDRAPRFIAPGGPRQRRTLVGRTRTQISDEMC